MLGASTAPKIDQPIPRPAVPVVQRPTEAEVVPQPSVQATPPSTEEAEAAAVHLYPALAVQGSALNTGYHAEYQRMKSENPAYFTNPSWPSMLAQRVLDQLSTGRTETMVKVQNSGLELQQNAPTNVPDAHSRGDFFTLTVTNVRSAKEIQRDNQTYGDAIPTYSDDADTSGSGGSIHDIDFTHQTGIKIEFQTLGPAPDPKEFTVEWFFVGKDANTKRRWIYDDGEVPLSGWGSTIVVSKPLDETRINESQYAFKTEPLDEDTDLLTVNESRTKHKSGDETEGWIVRVRDWGQIIRVDASLWELKTQAARPKDQLDAIAKSPSLAHLIMLN
jgi:hypothetical protein